MSHINKTDQHETGISLLRRVQKQDNEEAWADFMKFYTHFIYSVIRGMNISEADAADIHQQVILRLWKRLPEVNIDKMNNFNSYLRVTTRNEVLDFIRSERRRLSRETNAVSDTSLDYYAATFLPKTDHIAENEWRLHLATLAIEKIQSLFSKNAIEVFRKSMNGISVLQIAKELGLTANTVHSLKSRVKSTLTNEIYDLRNSLEREVYFRS
ncbi:RNA polymerase sigma factor [Pontiella sulfatireligans]|uniref:RNA polymerase sigma factor SigS n=1 Tax=Pontiella sulfatireligans TaxID=2750658 RepID=A0A6C2UHB8_9BACT|nr:sigma-70 family RNA polymerase sigma factor [Pontiella sulfatireligans]VGO19329.1 hypothetical protein SCARR_01387 [Pontiella sulfatireligans]